MVLRRDRARCAARAPFAGLVGLAVLSCAADPTVAVAPTEPRPPLACPAEWVSTAFGGCAPAVIACAPGARVGLAEGCGTAWPVRPRAVADDDGVMGQNLFSQPDGAVGGGWLRTEVPCTLGGARDPDGVCAWPPRAASQTPAGFALDAREVCEAFETFEGARYVDAAAQPGGDGSRARPFATAAAALAGTAATGIFVFAAGTYDLEPLTVRGALSLRGACARGVILRLASDGIVVQGNGAALTLKGVTLNAVRQAVVVDDGATLSMTRTALRGQQGVALDVGASSVSLLQSEVETLDATRDARAIVLRGGRLTAQACALRSAGGSVLAASGRAATNLDDVALRGRGAVEVVTLRTASTLTARRTLVEGGTTIGCNVTEGSVARLEDVVVRGVTGAPASSDRAGGVVVQAGARLDARELLIEDLAPAGLAVRDPQAAVTVEGMVVRGVRADHGPGRCVDVSDGARASLRRVALRGCRDSGLQVAEFARVDLRDASIREVGARGDGSAGFGLTVLGPGHLDARRVLVAGSAMGGLGAIGLPEALLVRAGLADALRARGEPGTTVLVSDLVIRDTTPVATAGSFALVTAAGVSLEGARIAIVDVPGVSVAVTPNGLPTGSFVTALVNAGRVPPAEGERLRRALPTSLDGGSSMRLTDVYVRQGPTWRVGFDPGARPQPGLRASIGAYVATGCALEGARLSIDGGDAGEYAVANLGSVRVDGLRARPMRRCALAAVPGAMATLTDAQLPAPSGCSAAGLEAVRLPFPGD